MKERIILHCDLNNFFASVSLLSNPTLYDLPVAVCGSVEERHGIVLAKNELAKAKGVKTAEAIWEAKRKCPNLVTLPPDYKKYHEYSEKAHKIYERYTDVIEPFGIDECWLDVTGSTMLFGSGEDIARRIQNDMKRELGITVSIGVSFNKIFAKLGSDNAGHNSIMTVSKDNFKDLIWDYSVRKLLFVGGSTAERLKEFGVLTIGDLARCDSEMLTRLLGKNGDVLRNYALGLDVSPVIPPSEDDVPKSIGRSVTPNHDITGRDEVWKIFLELSEDISRQLRKNGLYATGVQVHTRTVSLKVKEFSKSFSGGINSALLIAKKGMQLFDENYDFEQPLRSVGIRAIRLTDELAVQQDLFGVAVNDHREEHIEDSIQTVRDKFGRDSIKRGRIIE